MSIRRMAVRFIDTPVWGYADGLWVPDITRGCLQVPNSELRERILVCDEEYPIPAQYNVVHLSDPRHVLIVGRDESCVSVSPYTLRYTVRDAPHEVEVLGFTYTLAASGARSNPVTTVEFKTFAAKESGAVTDSRVRLPGQVKETQKVYLPIDSPVTVDHNLRIGGTIYEILGVIEERGFLMCSCSVKVMP